jgi:hypothetical protein
MSDARTATLRRMVLKFIADRLGDAKVTIDAEVLDALDRGDRKKVVLPGGADVGTLSVTDPKPTTKVADMSKLDAWVRAEVPHQIENVPAVAAYTRVYPAFVSKLVAECEVTEGGELVWPETGEIIPGLTVETKDPSVSPRQTSKQVEAMLAAFASGELRDIMLGVMSTEKLPEIEE